MEKIGYVLKGREVVSEDLIRVSVGFLNSNKTGGGRGRLGVNELPYIFHRISNSRYLNPDEHIGFDYTLTRTNGDIGGFPMTEGIGFPYLLDFQINDRKPNII